MQATCSEVRPPAVAGRFYPADAGELRRFVKGALAQRPDFGDLKPLALIAPHAGFVYSGKCAACGYGLLEGKQYRRVILLGPTHYGAFRGAALPAARAYLTPLGRVPIDTKAVAALREHPLFSLQPQAEKPEHSIETQIPFLQVVLPSFTMLPILVGELGEEDYGAVAKALLPFADDATLIVVSSDFTHFGSRFRFMPFRSSVRERIEALDLGAIEFIVAGDRRGFTGYVRRTGATICGRTPIAVLLELLALRSGPGTVPAAVLSYVTSADITGATADPYVLRQGSVSYASVAFLKPGSRKGGGTVSPLDQLPHETPLAHESLAKLLALARTTIERYLSGERHEDLAAYADMSALPAEAKLRAGAFVTLKTKGRLRGCIGSIYPRQPLWEAVVGNAIHAAVHDQRFSPVKKEELAGIDIEISVLSPPREIPGPEGFQVGTHGIIIEKQGKRAVFLPQVAPEQGWNREETLSHLARKAGLSSDAWREGTQFWIFEAQVSGEKE